ncbi:hypothetical protein PYH37_003465 [Sinorhizobium numidicum]|uniref:Secreted protein n=1 Tax=Sinorhizobium numidicum TaxID=680248 RepID=A0ABY8CTJ1_9HYPH|nr:hypothetical protein [Sinorhizobium numidicum]WEX78564.1 hypothetical protein PYH37_003465 [Sinorhizobium numidicum]WEX81961.1 hypothetical protein PYH38_004178 [Sinorhizobium numidicum]
MKSILVLAAAFALSTTAASAECLGHSKTTASVDKEMTTASVTQTEQSTPADELLLQQKQQQQEKSDAEE